MPNLEGMYPKKEYTDTAQEATPDEELRRAILKAITSETEDTI